MNKHLAGFLTLFILSTSLYSVTHREAVLVVKPNLTVTAKDFYQKLTEYFLNIGEKELSDYFKGLAEGKGYGSGFVISNGRNGPIVVTNRHVIGESILVTLEQELSDGTKRTYENLKVLFTDPVLDLAFIEYPKDSNIPVLKTETRRPGEGIEVWAAGYPGLLGRPSWQLSKGNVTNSRVTVPELGTDKGAQYLQHSASIDPGSSGGPLFSGSPDRPETWSVWGLNTWSAGGRANTFFSVPSDLFSEGLQRMAANLGSPETTPGKSIEFLKSFLASNEFSEFAFRQIVGNDYAIKTGWDSFNDGMRTFTTEERNNWLRSFFTFPIDTLRKFGSKKLFDFYRANKAVDWTQELEAIDSTTFRQKVKLTGTEMVLTWSNRSGVWLVSDMIFGPQAASTATTENPTVDNNTTVRSPLGVLLGMSLSLYNGGVTRLDIIGFNFRYDGPLNRNWRNTGYRFGFGTRFNNRGFYHQYSKPTYDSNPLPESFINAIYNMELFSTLGIIQYFPIQTGITNPVFHPFATLSLEPTYYIYTIGMNSSYEKNIPPSNRIYLTPSLGFVYKFNTYYFIDVDLAFPFSAFDDQKVGMNLYVNFKVRQ